MIATPHARPPGPRRIAGPSVAAAHAQKGETVKLAYIDALSGLMGPIGQNQVKSFQFYAEKFNKSNPAGVKFEMVTFDNKLSPAETLNHLKAAADQGIRYVMQGNGSSVALALSDAVAKHNERNPARKSSASTTRRWTRTSPTASATTGTSALTPTPR